VAVKFNYDRPSSSAFQSFSQPRPTFSEPGEYKVSGNRELRPTLIRDDGLRTYIEWGPSQAIPAVFAADRRGREQMVNGAMRSGTFTIDRVYEHLVFRIDRAKAVARRLDTGSTR
jgi:type IV secretion system protein VirB9